MLRPSYQWMAQMGAALGVIASLVLVAYELKQSQNVAMADIFQQRSVMALDLATSIYSPEALSQAHYRATYDLDSVNMVDLAMLRTETEARFIYFANEHFQYEIGMLSEEGWAAAKVYMAFVFGNPCNRRVWRDQENAWRESFAQEVNAIIQKGAYGSGECTLPTVEDLLPRG
ncbi:hypothetical protein [Congregibacter sp.]|uniref:hypothetical protein n=1 Tax=Congregibacter sp. TaxID=2744308 RepID=UPI003F6B972E